MNNIPYKFLKTSKAISDLKNNKVHIYFSNIGNIKNPNLKQFLIKFLDLKSTEVLKINKQKVLKPNKMKVIYTLNNIQEIKSKLEL
jgi:hypothetical protein